MREIESAVPDSFDARSRVARFDSEAQAVGDCLRIEFDLPDGPVHVWGDPRELDALFSNLVLSVGVVMHASGRMTVHLAPDDVENMPDEIELTDRARWLHVAIEDRGRQAVGTLFRKLLDPLVNVALQLAPSTGALCWNGRVLFEEGESDAPLIHLLLPYAAERDRGH